MGKPTLLVIGNILDKTKSQNGVPPMSHSHNPKSVARPDATARIISPELANIADMAAWFARAVHTRHALPRCAHRARLAAAAPGLLWHLDASQRQLVWACVCNIGWAALVARMHSSRTRLNRDHKLALALQC